MICCVTKLLLTLLTQDRYRELMRVSRIWDDMTNRKRAGFGHDKALASNPPPGSLALFCPACPQPGINLPPNWENEQDAEWKYAKVINMDGNFKADHIRMNTPDDVNLQNGLGFFVEKELYKKHLGTTIDTAEVCIYFSSSFLLYNF